MKTLLLLAFLLPALPLVAAINPAHFQRVASDRLKLREITRIIHEEDNSQAKLRRVTIVALVTGRLDDSNYLLGETIVIDYTVDLTARAKAAKDHEKRQGDRVGRQFLEEPEPPELDENGEFWAHLAAAGGRLGNVNRHAGAVIGRGKYTFNGKVFVPVAGQYSFYYPMD